MVINRIICISKNLTDTFAKVICNVLAVNMYWQNIKKFVWAWMVSVRLEKGTIRFGNAFKQIPLSFKIYANFECTLKVFKVMKVLIQKSIKIIFLVVLLINLFVLMINLVNRLLFSEVKMLLMNLLKQFLRSINIAKNNNETFQ